MRKLKLLLAVGCAATGAVFMLAPGTATAFDAASSDAQCIKATYVHEDQCFGPILEMCSGPPECFEAET